METDVTRAPRRRWKLRLALWAALFFITLPFIPIAAVIAAISVIGIPFALVLWIAPSLIILAAAADLGRDAFPRLSQPAAAIVSIGACVTLSFIAAAVANTGIDLQMRALLQDDHDAAAPPPISAIAIIDIDDTSHQKKSKRKKSRSRTERCDQICAEILVSRLQRGEGAYAAGLDLFAGKNTAERILIAARNGDRLDTTYQLTTIRAWKFSFLLHPAVVSGSGLNAKIGFPSRMILRNYPADRHRLDEVAALGDRLGIDLTAIR